MTSEQKRRKQELLESLESEQQKVEDLAAQLEKQLEKVVEIRDQARELIDEVGGDSSELPDLEFEVDHTRVTVHYTDLDALINLGDYEE